MFKSHLINALHGNKIFKIDFLKVNKKNLKLLFQKTLKNPFPKPKKNPFVDGSNVGLLGWHDIV
jgi:hypothetical protein